MRNYCVIIILLISVMLGNGCRAIRQVSESSKTSNNTSIQYKTVLDSIYIYKYDSVFIKETSDTIYKEIYKTFFRDRYHNDTVIIQDSIYFDKYITQTITETKNKLKWWQKFLMYSGIASILFFSFKIFQKFK